MANTIRCSWRPFVEAAGDGPRERGSEALMNSDQRVLNEIINRTVRQGNFFADSWARRPLYVTGACRALVGRYASADFLIDLVATEPAPYVVSGVRNGKRVYSRHGTVEAVRSAVRAGGVASIKLNRSWHEPGRPENWAWMRALFGSLFRATAMI